MPDYSQFTDQELAIFLTKGDELAYTQIYQRYFQLLYTYTYKKLRDQDQAKDILHDFFALLWVKRDQLPVIENLAAYFFTGINRKLIDYFLHQKVEAKYISSFAGFLQQEEGKTDHLIREKQLIAHIDAEINELPPRMREVFQLSRKQHLSHKEIAERMNISEKTVDRQVSNALNILRNRLGLLAWLLFLLRF